MFPVLKASKKDSDGAGSVVGGAGAPGEQHGDTLPMLVGCGGATAAPSGVPPSALQRRGSNDGAGMIREYARLESKLRHQQQRLNSHYDRASTSSKPYAHGMPAKHPLSSSGDAVSSPCDWSPGGYDPGLVDSRLALESPPVYASAALYSNGSYGLSYDASCSSSSETPPPPLPPPSLEGGGGDRPVHREGSTASSERRKGRLRSLPSNAKERTASANAQPGGRDKAGGTGAGTVSAGRKSSASPGLHPDRVASGSTTRSSGKPPKRPVSSSTVTNNESIGSAGVGMLTPSDRDVRLRDRDRSAGSSSKRSDVAMRANDPYSASLDFSFGLNTSSNFNASSGDYSSADVQEVPARCGSGKPRDPLMASVDTTAAMGHPSGDFGEESAPAVATPARATPSGDGAGGTAKKDASRKAQRDTASASSQQSRGAGSQQSRSAGSRKGRATSSRSPSQSKRAGSGRAPMHCAPTTPKTIPRAPPPLCERDASRPHRVSTPKQTPKPTPPGSYTAALVGLSNAVRHPYLTALRKVPEAAWPYTLSAVLWPDRPPRNQCAAALRRQAGETWPQNIVACAVRSRVIVPRVEFGVTGRGLLDLAHPAVVVVRSRTWRSAAHFFHSMKFSGWRHAEAVAGSEDPATEAVAVQQPLRHDWAVVQDAVMLEALRAKFDQHAPSREALLRTAAATLVCADPDAHWGVGASGAGRNRAGLLLETVRAALL
eukprot:TRINITY_DN2077_c0_g1_i1.p1 TRINITY_DN2077_c0_g1~~TRINITY_DN2077_c0_g1_i1.p1  ORF type:complete len:716 (+),score=151.70 TRINITY_DN2077_c0_g1_i1:155-2302(+)